jgi:beta-lactam-binding protein with PASTA domain
LFVAVVALAVSAFALGRSGKAATSTTERSVTTQAERPTSPVPDLLGLGQDQAMKVTASLGFQTTTTMQHSNTNPPTVVIAEHPAAGTRLPSGSTVEIVVSLGP